MVKIQAPLGNSPIPEDENDWIRLPSNDITQEQALWLNVEISEDIIGEVLITESIKSDSDDTTKEQQIKRCLTIAHPFIAVVKENYRFDYLVKREKLLEQILAK